MSAPRVFISHSASRDATGNTHPLWTSLQQELKARSFEVMDDSRLYASQDWRKGLYTWIGNCDAAVILFSPAAVNDSKFVLMEASIFYWRRVLSDNFKLLAVLLPGVSRDSFRIPEYSAIAPDLFEFINAQEMSVPDVTAKIVELLQPLQHLATPIKKSLEYVAQILSPTLPHNLRSLGTDIGADTASWVNDKDLPFLLAAELLSVPPKIFGEFFVESLSKYVEEKGHHLVEWASWFWFNPLPIAAIPDLVNAKTMMAIRARLQFTARAYVARAYCRYPTWSIVEVSNESGGDDYGHLSNLIWEGLDYEFRGTDGDRKRIREAIQRNVKQNYPMFIVIVGSVVESALIALQKDFAEFNFIIVTTSPVPALVKALEPAIDPPEEDELYDIHEISLQALKQLADASPKGRP